MVLPHFGGKFLCGGGDASFIFFVEVISAIAAASMVRKIFIDAFAAITEDAVPI
jgi:C4-dicarboxylate transporter